jgi:hypothetical protein
MSRIRLNSEYRNKIGNRMRVHLEQETTQEKEAYLQAREKIKPLQDETWKLAEKIVRKHYTPEDVKMAYHLQNKFDNVNTIAKDSCFHFGYMSKKDENEDEFDYDNEQQYNHNHREQDDKYITKHFDFRLNGNINGDENSKQNEFAYAYFRDELKGREDCNPDINIEQDGNQNNPHWNKTDQANEKYLGLNGGRENQTSYAKEWNGDYQLDLIGREYCRDRQIGCQKEEFDQLMIWQVAKGQLIQCHHKWIKSVLNQMKEIKLGLRGYRYLDEALELATELGLTINDAEIIRTNSTGLVIYNPKNLADRVKGMKNLNISREDKILARLKYDEAQLKQ